MCLVLLDLTTAFDTVSHSILLAGLQHPVGIGGSTLEWFRSYLVDRTLCVSLSCSESRAGPLSCGVPQGSVLGPLLFSLYLLPGISFYCDADDCQTLFLEATFILSGGN